MDLIMKDLQDRFGGKVAYQLPPRIDTATNDELIEELYRRGVKESKIYGLYYELDQIGEHTDKRLDAGLLDDGKIEPTEEKPF